MADLRAFSEAHQDLIFLQWRKLGLETVSIHLGVSRGDQGNTVVLWVGAEYLPFQLPRFPRLGSIEEFYAVLRKD